MLRPSMTPRMREAITGLGVSRRESELGSLSTARTEDRGDAMSRLAPPTREVARRVYANEKGPTQLCDGMRRFSQRARHTAGEPFMSVTEDVSPSFVLPP